jgi:quercetin dioxygenase-like cupin family protein
LPYCKALPPRGGLQEAAIVRRSPPEPQGDHGADHPELGDSNLGPSDWFTGTVYLDSVATPSGPSRVAAGSVHFTPGARTAWHTHPFGQTIYVTEGIGRCQRRGGPVDVIRPGDRVYFEPGEDHWHGAAPAGS